eukprot:6186652-Pleurochrysis_carterae.AAC.2
MDGEQKLRITTMRPVRAKKMVPEMMVSVFPMAAQSCVWCRCAAAASALLEDGQTADKRTSRNIERARIDNTTCGSRPDMQVSLVRI